jgi:hypothetical protein
MKDEVPPNCGQWIPSGENGDRDPALASVDYRPRHPSFTFIDSSFSRSYLPRRWVRIVTCEF